MTAPAPQPGSTNPFLLAYQNRQFDTLNVGNPASVGGPENLVSDYLATVPAVTITTSTTTNGVTTTVSKESSIPAAATADWNKYKRV